MSSVTLKLAYKKINYWIGWLNQGFSIGKWPSYFTGRGYDFRGTVPYHEDPDPVRINLALTAIERKPYVNVFSEERGVGIYLLGNLSPAMAFGSGEWTKIERLALLTALISFSALRNKDQFRFFGYTSEVELGFPQPWGRGYPLLLAKTILNFDWRNKSRGGLLKTARRIPPRKSLVIIISDLLGDLTGVPETLRLLSPPHDILPIVLWDKMEVEFPRGLGLVPMRDLETGRQSHVLLCKKTREALKRNIAARRSEIQKIFRRFGIKPFFFTEVTESDLEALIKVFLEKRGRF